MKEVSVTLAAPVESIEANQRLLPYLPRLVVDWLEREPERTVRSVTGTGVFADISGFTQLTERLAKRGKVGAEEMGETLNLVFDELLTAAYNYGAGLVKWGGDAVLLLFDGDHHATRAATAAAEMQRVMARVGKLQTSAGKVRLRMSIGIHSGELDFMLVGSLFRELIITGPAATCIAQMEKLAAAGEIVVSPHTATLLESTGAVFEERTALARLLVSAPPAVEAYAPRAVTSTVDLRQGFSPQLARHLMAGAADYEHRTIVVCFLEFSGIDAMRNEQGIDAAASAVGSFVDACQQACKDNDVTLLSSDISEDGGKIILTSGAPFSAGDDAARILTAARQVLDGDHLLSVRAGVNLGSVFAGDYGPWFRRVYSVTGDCVNLAARLMSRAVSGQLIATPVVIDRSRTRFETAALEPFAVKGKADLIEALDVGAIKDGKVGVRPSTPLMGRKEELALLLAAADAAQRGDGRVIEIVGEAGIGKSRLIDELVDRSEAQVLWLDGDIYSTSRPYSPFHRLFRFQAGLDDAADADLVASAVASMVALRSAHLTPLLPLIGTVAGVELPMTPEVDAMDPTIRKERLETATSEALGHALDAPTILVFNDVHFMDEASADLLDQLIRDVADRPWLLIASRRPASRWKLDSAASATSMALKPLSADAADDLLAATLGEAKIPAHRIATLVERAGGNPLFLTELAASVSSESDGASDATIPDSIEGVIASRIDLLEPGRKSFLRAAAVLGMRVDPALLEGMIDRSSDEVSGLLASLPEYFLPLPGGDFRFLHHLVRETAYEGLAFKRRVQLHARTADLLDARSGKHPDQLVDLLSLHCFHGQRFSDAFLHSRRAGQIAQSQYANTEASECFQRAIDCSRHISDIDVTEWLDIAQNLAELYSWVGEFDAMEKVLKEARSRASGHLLMTARLAWLTALHRRLTAQYSQALRWLTTGRRALQGAQSRNAAQMLATFSERYAHICLSQGRHRLAIEWAERACAEARLAEDAITEARAVEIRWLAADASGQSVDLSLAAKSIDLFEKAGDLKGLARSRSVLGVLSLSAGDWRSALEHYDKARETYSTIGRLADVALMQANQAEILISQGNLDQAEDLLVEAMKMWRGSDAVGELAFGLSQQGRIALARGDFPLALELFEKAREMHESIGESFEALTVDALIAERMLVSGDATGALDYAQRSMARVRNAGDLSPQAPQFLRVKGLSLLALHRTGEGIECLRESITSARELASPYEVAMAISALLRSGTIGAAEASELARERAEISTRLGIVGHSQLP